MIRVSTYVFFLFFLFRPVAAACWQGKVVRVADGDTVVVERIGGDRAGERVTIRLHGIDAPELGSRNKPSQPYCGTSARFLGELLQDRDVVVMDMGYDKYSRTIGAVMTVPDGRIAQEELLRAGLAWVYAKYCRGCDQWRELQRDARRERLGLWGDDAALPPWEWRKMVRENGRAVPETPRLKEARGRAARE